MADIRAITTPFDLSGPEEHPMRLGGRWGPVDTTWPENYKGSGLGFGADNVLGLPLYWSLNMEGVYTGDMEGWGTRTGGSLGVAGEGWRIGFWDALSLGGGNTARGYVGLYFHALFDGWFLRRYDAPDDFTELDATSPGLVGGIMLMRRRGRFIEVWAGTDYNTWTLILSAEDDTYSSNMMVGFASEDPTHGGVGWEAVGGGKKMKTRYIRYVSN